MTFLYFAYGSNMLSKRLWARTPSARAIDIGNISGHRLTFNKVSKDGSGKCNAEFTNVQTDLVYGVIFEINKNERKALDDAEGFGFGYDSISMNVCTENGKINALAYIATDKENNILPYHWYKAFVVAGAVEHGLPSSYIEWIRAFNSKRDFDLKRRAENEALLFSS